MGFLKYKELFNALHSLGIDRVVHTLLRSPGQVNTSCQVQASQEQRLSNPADLHALQQSSTRLKEEKKGNFLVCGSSPASFIHMAVSDCLLQNIWNVFTVVPLLFKH